MDDDINSSLNSTFCLDDNQSFLNYFGTPKNFKIMLDRPATVGTSKYNPECVINFKEASRIRLNHKYYDECNANTDNNSAFLSPLPMNRLLQRNKFKNCSPSFISPINNRANNNYQIYASPSYYDFKSPLPESFPRNIEGTESNKFNYKRSNIDSLNFLSPIKSNISTKIKVYSPMKNSEGKVMMTLDKGYLEESKHKEFNMKQSQNFKERFDTNRSEMRNSRRANYSPLFSPHESLSPLNTKVYSNQEYSDYLSAAAKKCRENIELERSRQAYIFRPITDSDGNIMMSAAKKKLLEEEEAKKRGEITQSQREEMIKIFQKEVRESELEIKRLAEIKLQSINPETTVNRRCSKENDQNKENINIAEKDEKELILTNAKHEVTKPSHIVKLTVTNKQPMFVTPVLSTRPQRRIKTPQSSTINRWK